MKALILATALLLPLAQSLGGGALGNGSLGAGAAGHGATGGGNPGGCPALPDAVIEFDPRNESKADNEAYSTRANTGTGGATWDQSQGVGAQQPTHQQASDCLGLGQPCVDYNLDHVLRTSTGLTWPGSDMVICSVIYHRDGAAERQQSGWPSTSFAFSLTDTAWRARNSTTPTTGHTLAGPQWAVYCVDFNDGVGLSDTRWSGSETTLSVNTGTLILPTAFYSGTSYVGVGARANSLIAYTAVWDTAVGATLEERITALECEFGL